MKSLFDENLFKAKERRSKSEADNRALKADYSREQLKKQIVEAFLLNNFEDQKETKISRVKNAGLLPKNQHPEKINLELRGLFHFSKIFLKYVLMPIFFKFLKNILIFFFYFILWFYLFHTEN